MARRLVADGADSFYRVLTDPRDGAPLEIGRSSYRVTKAQRQWLRLRDGKCPFPGCNNPSLDNEADHLLAWADGGTTGIANLGQPCPQTPPPETRLRLDTHPGQQRRAAGMDLTVGTVLPERAPGLGTTPLARPHDHRRRSRPGHRCRSGPASGRGQHRAPNQVPGWDLETELPPDPFPDWHHFTLCDELAAADPDDQAWLAPRGDGFLEDLLLLHS